MARNLYFYTQSSDPRKALIKSPTQLTAAERPVFVRGDNNPTNLYLVSESGGYHADSGSGSVTPKLALVTPGAVPTGGTFKVEHSANASAAIDFDATASELQTILNAIASVTSAGGVTVSGSAGCWTVTWVNTGAQSDFTENDNSLTPDGSIGISKITDGDGSTQEVISIELKRQPHTIQTSWSTITSGWTADFAMVDQKLCDLLNGAAKVDTTLELEITDASGKIRTYGQVPCTLLGDGINTGVIANQVGSTYYTATESDNLFLKIAQNLADLNSASTSRTNLGISAVNTPFTPTTSGDWSSPPTEVGGALDELANRTNGISATKTESAEVSVSAAGDTDLDPADDQAVSTFFVAAAAGAGTYTRNLLLKQPTPGEVAQVALVRLSLAASGNPTLKVYDDTTGGTLLHTAIGNAKRARTELAIFVWNNDSTQWELLNEPQGSGIGLQTMFVPARALTSRGTNGASASSAESTTNKVMRETLDFDASTNEFAQFEVIMPKGWNEGTVYAQFVWTATSGSGDVVWGLQGVSIEDNEALDAAFGTAQEATDTLNATDYANVSSYTSAITVSGAAEDALTYFQVYRNAADAGDTHSADAQLIGIRLLFAVDQANDD